MYVVLIKTATVIIAVASLTVLVSTCNSREINNTYIHINTYKVMPLSLSLTHAFTHTAGKHRQEFIQTKQEVLFCGKTKERSE